MYGKHGQRCIIWPKRISMSRTGEAARPCRPVRLRRWRALGLRAVVLVEVTHGRALVHSFAMLTHRG
jgi:hypothetical protein